MIIGDQAQRAAALARAAVQDGRPGLRDSRAAGVITPSVASSASEEAGRRRGLQAVRGARPSRLARWQPDPARARGQRLAPPVSPRLPGSGGAGPVVAQPLSEQLDRAGWPRRCRCASAARCPGGSAASGAQRGADSGQDLRPSPFVPGHRGLQILPPPFPERPGRGSGRVPRGGPRRQRRGRPRNRRPARAGGGDGPVRCAAAYRAGLAITQERRHGHRLGASSRRARTVSSTCRARRWSRIEGMLILTGQTS